MLSHNDHSTCVLCSVDLKHELFLRRKRKVSGSAHFIFITPVPPLLFGVSFKVNTVYSCHIIKMSAKIYSAMTVPSVIHPCLLGHVVIKLIKIAASSSLVSSGNSSSCLVFHVCPRCWFCPPNESVQVRMIWCL